MIKVDLIYLALFVTTNLPSPNSALLAVHVLYIFMGSACGDYRFSWYGCTSQLGEAKNDKAIF